MKYYYKSTIKWMFLPAPFYYKKDMYFFEGLILRDMYVNTKMFNIIFHNKKITLIKTTALRTDSIYTGSMCMFYVNIRFYS